MTDPEGTYLVWIDFSGYGLSDEGLEEAVTDKAKLWLDSGKDLRAGNRPIRALQYGGTEGCD